MGNLALIAALVERTLRTEASALRLVALELLGPR